MIDLITNILFLVVTVGFVGAYTYSYAQKKGASARDVPYP